METQLPEIIDRITILILKIERSDNSAFVEELNEYNMALKEYEDKKRISSKTLKRWKK